MFACVCDLSLLLHVRRALSSFAFAFAIPLLLRVVSSLFFLLVSPRVAQQPRRRLRRL